MADRYLDSDVAFLMSLLFRVEKSDNELFTGFHAQAKSFVDDFEKLTPQQQSMEGYKFLGTMQGILEQYEKDGAFKESLDQLHKSLGAFLTKLVENNLWDVCGAAKRTQVYGVARVPVPDFGENPS